MLFNLETIKTFFKTTILSLHQLTKIAVKIRTISHYLYFIIMKYL